MKYSRSVVVSARIILVEKPGNTPCFDSEVDRHSPMEYSVYKKDALFINHIILPTHAFISLKYLPGAFEIPGKILRL